MKKLNLLFLALIFIIGISSCKKDDPEHKPIVGEWRVTDIHFTGNIGQGGFSLPVTGKVTNLSTINATVNFLKNQTVITNASDEYNVEITVFGQTLSDKTSTFTDWNKWERDEEKLTVTGDDFETEFKILSLTKKKLVGVSDKIPGGLLENNGIDADIDADNVEFYITLEK